MEGYLSLIAMWPIVMLLLLPGGESAPLYDKKWKDATATWYPGQPGEGNPDGGACGYGNLNQTAHKRMSTAVSGALWMDERGCGACYKVKCVSDPLCRAKPIRVTVTDHCPGGGATDWCGAGKAHFDMTREAFKAMSIKGQEDNFPHYMNRVIYKRVPCVYKKKNIAFFFKTDSNDWWKILTLLSVGGPGTVTDVFIKPAGYTDYYQMRHNWGASFDIQASDVLRGPFYIKLVNMITKQTLECPRPIPEDFKNDVLYNCGAQWALPPPPPSTSLSPLPPSTLSSPSIELAPPSSSLNSDDQIIDFLDPFLTSPSPPSSPPMDLAPPSSSLKDEIEGDGVHIKEFLSSNPSLSFTSHEAPSFYPESLMNKKRFLGTISGIFEQNFDFSDLDEETEEGPIDPIG